MATIFGLTWTHVGGFDVYEFTFTDRGFVSCSCLSRHVSYQSSVFPLCSLMLFNVEAPSLNSRYFLPQLPKRKVRDSEYDELIMVGGLRILMVRILFPTNRFAYTNVYFDVCDFATCFLAQDIVWINLDQATRRRTIKIDIFLWKFVVVVREMRDTNHWIQ